MSLSEGSYSYQLTVSDPYGASDSDTVEITVLPECRYLRKRYVLEQIPEDLCIGSIKRNSEFIIPNIYFYLLFVKHLT